MHMPCLLAGSRHRLARQRGAVLYVALIFLIVLALLGLIGMQVSGLQERMARNYRSTDLAFQAAELRSREAECAVEAAVNRTTSSCGAVSIRQQCDDGFDAARWARERSLDTPRAERVIVREIGPCIAGSTSLAGGGALEENPNPVYQVTAYATDPDSAEGAGADAAIDTIFRP